MINGKSYTHTHTLPGETLMGGTHDRCGGLGLVEWREDASAADRVEDAFQSETNFAKNKQEC